MAPVIPGQCCIPPPVSDYKGVGREDVWDDLSVYLTGSTQTQSAVVFIVDIYGTSLTCLAPCPACCLANMFACLLRLLLHW